MDSKNLTSKVPVPPGATIVSPKAPNYRHSWLPLPPSGSEIAFSLALEPLQELLHPPPWELLAETARNGRRGWKRQTRGETVSNAAGTSPVALKFTDSTGTKAGKWGKVVNKTGSIISKQLGNILGTKEILMLMVHGIYSNGKTTLYEQVQQNSWLKEVQRLGVLFFFYRFPVLLTLPSCAALARLFFIPAISRQDISD